MSSTSRQRRRRHGGSSAKSPARGARHVDTNQVRTAVDRLRSHPLPTFVARYLRPPFLIGAGLLALTVWIFERQLFAGWSFPWDFLGTYTTTPAFVAATFGHAHPVSWSPFVASGFPVDVDPQAGLYFPGWWLLGALRIPATLSVLTDIQVAHVLFGGIGMLCLARARRLAWPWAAMCSVAYLFFGGYYGQAEHADMFRGFSYLPWLLWALTPPNRVDGKWTRLIAVPPIVWLIASGTYPGQIVSFGLTGTIYVLIAIRLDPMRVWREHRRALALVALASVATCLVVFIPFIRAEHANELFRENEPTATARAGFSIAPLDFFGLYLNNFAWTPEGTITTWVIGIPTLIGVALARRLTLRSQAPLIVCGVVALALAMTPRIGFIGQAMTSLRPLFPGRFPAAEYKAVVAVALILTSGDAWSRLPPRRDRATWIGLALASVVLAGGALLVPSTYAQPTQELWLVFAVILACVALALASPPAPVLACLLVVLLVVDGTREIHDYRLAGVVSPWQALAPEPSFYEARDQFVRELPGRLERTMATRPAREPSVSPPEPEASGWVADSYQESDYDPTIERSLWRAEHNPAWLALLLAPWHAYTFPCSTVGCSSGHVHLPTTSTWRSSPYVHTTSYGIDGIDYAVYVSQPTLLVENELAVRGWRAGSPHVHRVDTDLPFRAWYLSPGRYRFSATFHEPGRSLQYIALVCALGGWLACVLILSSPKVPFRNRRARLS
jgi:hypothetical protein